MPEETLFLLSPKISGKYGGEHFLNTYYSVD